jgi:hypothetical protein
MAQGNAAQAAIILVVFKNWWVLSSSTVAASISRLNPRSSLPA